VAALALLAPAAPSARAFTALGAAPAGTELRVVLPLRVDARGLEHFARSVSDPRSPSYGRYESVAELSRRFGATETVRARVLDYLRATGATDVRIDATGLLAQATLTVGLAQRLFGVPLRVRHSTNGARFIAPTAAPGVPAALRGLIEGVIGLDTEPLAERDFELRRSPRATVRAASSQPSSETRRTGTPAGCPAGTSAGELGADPATAGFTPNQYLDAYDFAALHAGGAAGQGERVALIEIDGFKGSDVDAFAQCFGLSVPEIDTYGVNLSSPLPPGGESTLDVEVLDAAAPSLRGIDVYETNASPSDLIGALVAPLQVAGHKPQVVSASLGLCERDWRAAVGLSGLATAERALEFGAASGVSYLASSGDAGSSDCRASDGSPLDLLAVHYPASSWWVTGVGGTNFSLTPSNQIANQIVWNDTTDQLAAGGGGPSALLRRPSYQDGVVARDARAVPDVAMLADLMPGYAIYCTATFDCINSGNVNPWLTVGGTSAGTPLLAGGIALVDQELRGHGRQDAGFLNPLLYALGRSQARASVFYDVTAIGNDLGPYIKSSGGRALGCCSATPGYDDASGWGSVDLGRFAAEALTIVAYALGRVSLGLPAHQHPLAKREIVADVKCTRPSYVAAYAKVQIGHHTPFEVDSSIYDLPRGGRKAITIGLSPHQRSAIRSALRSHQSVLATVYGVIVDRLGTIQASTKGQRLAIRG